MITIDKEKLIRKLLSEGETAVSIAERVNVSRKLVGKIRKLQWIRDRRGGKRRKKTGVPKKLKEPRRCGMCGGKVTIWPCLLCNPKGGCY